MNINPTSAKSRVNFSIFYPPRLGRGLSLFSLDISNCPGSLPRSVMGDQSRQTARFTYGNSKFIHHSLIALQEWTTLRQPNWWMSCYVRHVDWFSFLGYFKLSRVTSQICDGRSINADWSIYIHCPSQRRFIFYTLFLHESLVSQQWKTSFQLS